MLLKGAVIATEDDSRTVEACFAKSKTLSFKNHSNISAAIQTNKI